MLKLGNYPDRAILAWLLLRGEVVVKSTVVKIVPSPYIVEQKTSIA